MKKNASSWMDALICSGAGMIGFYFLTGIDGEHILGAQSFVAVILFVLLTGLYKRRIPEWNFRKDKRKFVFSAGFSFLFALTFIAGYQMRVSAGVAPGFAGKVGLVFKSILLAFVFFPFFELILNFFDRVENKQIAKLSKPENKGLWSVWGANFLSWGIIFVCWIPVFLAYYPAIMSYDSNRQFQEAYEGIFWELQPIAHTGLIRLSLLLGEAMGSYELGMAFYSLLQMLTLSFALAFGVAFVYELTGKKWTVFATSFTFGLFPVFPVLSMVVTKDIFFSAFFLILTVLCIRRFRNTPKHPVVYDILMVLLTMLISIFRKNGVYGFALFAVFYILAMKKERIHIILLCVVMLAAGISGPYLVRAVSGGAPGPKTEMYSVPIQQMGHVVFYQKDSLSPEELATMEYYLQGSTSWESFNITLADSQKACANSEAWTNTPQMLKDWCHFLVRYPDDYINAYLGLTLGYWFTDDITISQHLGYGREEMRGLIETFNASKPLDDCYPGVQSVSKLPRLQYFLEGIVSDEQYLRWPVLSALFRPAFYCWIGFVLFGIFIYKKRYRELAAASLQIAYFCTVLLGPVANIRYMFQLLIALPVLAAFLISSLQEKR